MEKNLGKDVFLFDEERTIKLVQDLCNNNEKSQVNEGFSWVLLRCRGSKELETIENIKKHAKGIDTQLMLGNDTLPAEQHFKYFILLSYPKKYESKDTDMKIYKNFSGYFIAYLLLNDITKSALHGKASIIKHFELQGVYELLNNFKQNVNIKQDKSFFIGEQVRISKGLFNNENEIGTIVSLDNEKKVAIVEINLFNRITPIETYFDEIEKMDVSHIK